MRTVKMLLYHGTGIIGSIIRWRTWGDYAHVAVQVGDDVYESVEGQGVIVTPADEHMESREPDLVIEVPVPRAMEINLEEWYKSQVGCDYDYTAIYGFIVRRDRQNNGKWFCSEYVAEGFKQAGMPLQKTDTWKISPQLVAISPVI